MVSAERAPHHSGVGADGDPIGAVDNGFYPPTMTDITGERVRVRYDTATVAGGARPARHRLPEPPPTAMSVCEQTRIERIPLTDVGVGIDGEPTEPEYAVVLHTVRPAAATATGPERIGLTIDTSAGQGALAGDAGDPGRGFDDMGIVRSVN